MHGQGWELDLQHNERDRNRALRTEEDISAWFLPSQKGLLIMEGIVAQNVLFPKVMEEQHLYKDPEEQQDSLTRLYWGLYANIRTTGSKLGELETIQNPSYDIVGITEIL